MSYLVKEPLAMPYSIAASKAGTILSFGFFLVTKQAFPVQ
jgi:hypothetical protein